MSYPYDDDNEFEQVDEEETDEESEDDDDESDEDDDDDDDQDEDARLARIETAFRAERALIRACDDVAELRTKRREYQAVLSNGEVIGVGRLRINDLIELIDDRTTDLKAKRFAAGRA
ncbi:MAG: hypothetical protein ACOZNI_11335 [Myxococcota bacterium]